MMAEKIASLYAEISADTSKFLASMVDAKASVEEFAKGAEMATREGADFRRVIPGLDDYIDRLKAATPENAKLAAESGKVIQAFEKGELSAKDAAAALETLRNNAQKTGDAMGKTGTETAKASSKFKAFAGGLNETVQNLTGLNLATLGVAGAVGLAGKAIKDSINNWSEYASTVDKFAMSTGMAAEEASRLIQVADDMRVETGSLENALKLALQNGFNPTIDNMARLADEFNNISDPTERAARMQEVFGRSWIELIPLLEQGGKAIRDAAGEIDDSLIVTEKGIKHNREWIKAVDDLKDSWTGVQNQLAQGLIPTLTDLIDLSVKISNQNGQDTFGERLLKSIPIISAVSTAYQGWSAAVDENQKKLEENSATAGWAAREARYAGEAQTYTAEATEAAGDSAEKSSGQWSGLAPQFREVGDAAKDAATNAELMARASAELADAQNQLKDATEAWKQSVGSDLGSMLEQAGLSTATYKDGLSAVDEIMGTSLLPAQQLQEAQQKLVDEYRRTGDIEAFKEGLVELKETFAPLDASIKSSTALVDELQQKLNDFSRVYTATVRVVTEGSINTSTGGKYKPGVEEGDIPGKASGGPVMANYAYWVGEQGPELFVPQTSGNILPNGQTLGLSSNVNIYATVTNAVDVEALTYQVARRLGRGR